ncbi:MAG: Hsp20/alpha crystallin family protein [Patescibacteria group bacterium]|jgi:HSP20 family protein
MTLIKWTPFWEPFEDMDKMFSGVPALSSNAFVPSLDIYQDNNNVIVEAPLAGIKPNDVNIVIENDVLTIEGKAEKKSEIDDKNYYRKEIRSGSFHRSVALPVGVNGDLAKAEYQDGILKITVPKQEQLKAKNVKIEIK